VDALNALHVSGVTITQASPVVAKDTAPANCDVPGTCACNPFGGIQGDPWENSSKGLTDSGETPGWRPCSIYAAGMGLKAPADYRWTPFAPMLTATGAAMAAVLAGHPKLPRAATAARRAIAGAGRPGSRALGPAGGALGRNYGNVPASAPWT
jgi:hypothetical protein